MKVLKIILIVLLVLTLIGMGGVVLYFENRTPGPTFANDMDIGAQISYSIGN